MMQVEEVKWYVMNATYGNAMNAQAMLCDNSIHCYVPMEYRFVPSKNQKMVKKLRPIMQNLIFVKATYSRIREMSTRCSYLHFQYTKVGGDNRNRPIVVDSDEMERFINFLDGRFEDVEYLDMTNFDIRRGERVMVVDGVFKGKEGTLVSVSGKRYKQIVVSIDGVLAIQIKTPKPWAIVERIQ